MKADCDFDTWGAEDGTCTLPCNVTRANTCISLPSIGIPVFKMMFKYMYVCKKKLSQIPVLISSFWVTGSFPARLDALLSCTCYHSNIVVILIIKNHE